MTSTMLEQLKLKGNDIDEYIERFEGDEETCEMLLSLFFNETDIEKYFDALSVNDFTSCVEILHEIKGASANVGLTLVSKTAKAISQALSTKDFYTVTKLNDDIRRYYNDAKEIVTH